MLTPKQTRAATSKLTEVTLATLVTMTVILEEWQRTQQQLLSVTATANSARTTKLNQNRHVSNTTELIRSKGASANYVARKYVRRKEQVGMPGAYKCCQFAEFEMND